MAQCPQYVGAREQIMKLETIHLPSLSVTYLGNLHFQLYNSRFCEFQELDIQKIMVPSGNPIIISSNFKLWLPPEYFRFCAETPACRKRSHYMAGVIDTVHQKQVELLLHNEWWEYFKSWVVQLSIFFFLNSFTPLNCIWTNIIALTWEKNSDQG